jgi:inner membrane protein
MTNIPADAAARKPPPENPSTLGSLMRTPAARVAMILALLLLMQIPLRLLSGLIGEREERQAEVLAGFRHGWGPDQAVFGPILAVPYAWVEPPARVGLPATTMHGWLRVLPSRLQVVATLTPETRRRGLFHAVVYTASVALSGALTIPVIDTSATPGAVIDWAGARVAIGASDLRGMAPDARMDWNGEQRTLDLAEDAGFCRPGQLSVPAGFSTAPGPGMAIPFRTALTLRGTDSFRVVPLGRQIEMRVTSDWPTPSFVGADLPVHADIDADKGFDARWDIAGASGVTRSSPRDQMDGDCGATSSQTLDDIDARVGVQLQEAVPTYLMVSRAAKYGVLFLTMSYLTLFLFEMLSGVRIHIVQYGLLGLSVSLFALLLISIAEPLGFGAAYAISTVAVLAQSSLYTLSVVRRRRLAWVFCGVMAGLFAFLYVVLSLNSYALLAGTVALFLALSVVMLATRRVNWSAMRDVSEPA